MDKEKVMSWLEGLAEPDWRDCYSDSEVQETAKQALDLIDELLKEQEEKPMTEYDDGWDCPRCGLKLVGKTASGYPCDELDLPNDEIVKYCPVCGQAVKWDE